MSGWSRAVHPQPGGQYVPKLGLGLGMIPPRGHFDGDLDPDVQRVRVIGALHPQLGRQYVPKLGLGCGVLPRVAISWAMRCRVNSVSG